MTYLTRDPDVKASVLPDGHVLLHLERNDWCYTLTPLGGLVWEYCDGDHAPEDIVRRIEAIPDVSPDSDLLGKVEELLRTLEGLGLLLRGPRGDHEST
jgi:Coenzyme PQQ synthesis protein D (PqqD)